MSKPVSHRRGQVLSAIHLFFACATVSYNRNGLKQVPTALTPGKYDRWLVEDIRQFFKELQKGERTSDTVKLVIMGERRAGKSSLINTMTKRIHLHWTDPVLDVSVELSKDEEAWSEIVAPVLQKSDQRTITLDRLSMGIFNVYDFGGQSEYFPWQKIFLTKDTLYLIAVDISGQLRTGHVIMGTLTMVE